eukprot:9166862-Alexandrium_andersonii.AAC.1
MAKHDLGNAAALPLEARRKMSVLAARTAMPRFDSVDRGIEPLANAAVALAAAYILRYAGWLRSNTHHRNVLRRIEIANIRASTE